MCELKKISSLINERKDPSLVRELLCNFLGKNKEELTGKMHPLGFYSFHLNQNLRLNIWDKNLVDSKQKNLNIHDHIFNLTSLVLKGRIKNTVYKIKQASSGDHIALPVIYENNKSTIKSKSQLNVNCEISSQNIINENEYYFLDSDQYHTSEALEHQTISLIHIKRNPNKDIPYVISKDMMEEDTEFKRRLLSKNDGMNMITNILKILYNSLQN